MIHRLMLHCHGCEEGFWVRMELLPSQLTRLAIPCPHCSYCIRGRFQGMELDDVKVEWYDATVSATPDIPPPDDVAVLTVGSSVPLNPGARMLSDFGGGPNITFGELIGDNLRANAIHARFHGLGPTWKRYEQFLHYYLTKQWDRFNATGAKLYENTWKTTESAQARHAAALLPAHLLLLPLIPKRPKSDLFEAAIGAVQRVATKPGFIAWAISAEVAGSTARVQRALFEQLRSFMRIWESWAPGLVVRWTHPSKIHLLESLRVFRDDFEILRDVYVQVYETCCRALPVVVAVVNTEKRGDPDIFGPVPASILQANARATSPSNLAAFEKLPNAKKLQWFQDWTAWADGLPALLDRRIRNTIGHASAHYDVQSGNVIGDDLEMSYLNFTTATFDLFYPLFTLLQVINSVRLVAAENWTTGRT
jgi:hypothetical protein